MFVSQSMFIEDDVDEVINNDLSKGYHDFVNYVWGGLLWHI